MKQIILRRLKEPSTWIGISMLATLFGVPPGLIDGAAKIVIAVGSIMGIAVPEQRPGSPEDRAV